MNQHWYGFTALALVCGLAIGVSGILYWSVKGKKTDFTPRIVIPFCGDIPPPPPPGNPHWIFELSQGTKASFIQYKTPKPAPKKELFETGIKKKLTIKDSESDVRSTCLDCEFTLPEIPAPEEDQEDWIFFDEPNVTACKFDFDKEPRPLNLPQIKNLISYPKFGQREGGTIVISVLIDRNGRYKRHIIRRSDNPQLLSSIETHIVNLRFTPSIVKGRPKKCWINIPFRITPISDKP